MISDISIKYTHPKWFIDKWLKNWSKDEVVKLLKWNNSEPEIWFRINILKTSIKEIHKFLNSENIDFVENKILKEYFSTNSIQRILQSRLMKEGLLSVQNPANGLVVKLLDPKSNEIIFDGCAAPGGKAIAISEQVSNKGEVLAYDVSKKRLERLNNSISKQRIRNIKTEVKDSSKDILRDSSKMIADVPCLSTGTISKNVDLKWKKTVDDLDRLTNLQEQILNNSVKYLRLNGVIVYSTCSIEQEENWMLIDIKANNELALNTFMVYSKKQRKDVTNEV